jgi:hypothetical protein
MTAFTLRIEQQTAREKQILKEVARDSAVGIATGWKAERSEFQSR